MHWKSENQHYHVKEFVTLSYVPCCTLSELLRAHLFVNSWRNCYEGPSAGMPECCVISVSLNLNKNYNSHLNVVI